MQYAKNPLTVEEARRAIYVDFEGRKDLPPALLGVLYAEGRKASDDRLVLRQDIVERTFWDLLGCAEVQGFSRYDSDARTLRASIADVCRRAKEQERCIVSWSRYDATAIAEHGGSPFNRRVLRTWYRDGKATAKRWSTICRPDLHFERSDFRGAHQLTKYLDAIGYALPSDYGKGEVGAHLRAVAGALDSRGSWDALRPSTQDQWLAVLAHNAHDVLGTRRLMLHTSTDLLSASG